MTYPDGSSETFAYDPVGNRTSLVQAAAGGPGIETIYVYGPANRLLFTESAVETNVYTFDAAGQLVGQTVYSAGGGTGGLTRAYGYEFQSRMTSLTDTNGSVFSYAFDGEGNRIRQNLNGCLETRFVYDGANAVLEMSAEGGSAYGGNVSNEVVWAWIHGPGLDQPVERIAFINGEARNRQVVHADGLGSVAALTDESGETVQTYVYNAFGCIRTKSGTDLNRVTFTAREAVGDSLGFYYYRHRIYDPHTGRFTSEDPLGFVDGANRYVYCGNNPVNIVDPFGLAWYDNWHYEGRDAHNSNLPSSPEAADLAGGTLLSPEMSKYHDDPCTPGPEKKFIFPGGEEAVYNDETGQLVTDPRYKGTYNYVNPAPPSRNPLKWPGIVGRGAGHFFADMLPYYIWGNERPSEDESDHCK